MFKKMVAEFIGTAVLVVFGCGTAMTVGCDAVNGGGYIIEVILTFVFVLAILGVTSKVENGAVAGIVIGLTLTLVHILGIGLTGTSVNPARSFGPALLAGGDALKNVWVFIAAPAVGGALAALCYNALDAKKK